MALRKELPVCYAYVFSLMWWTCRCCYSKRKRASRMEAHLKVKATRSRKRESDFALMRYAGATQTLHQHSSQAFYQARVGANEADIFG